MESGQLHARPAVFPRKSPLYTLNMGQGGCHGWSEDIREVMNFSCLAEFEIIVLGRLIGNLVPYTNDCIPAHKRIINKVNACALTNALVTVDVL
jgi:hypothetical protein